VTKRNRSNESNFDRGWGSDRRMRTFTARDGTRMEGISLPKGEPPPPGSIGRADRYIPGYIWWTRIVALIVSIFLCAWLRPMFIGLVNAVG